jgi:hypothetical protein
MQDNGKVIFYSRRTLRNAHFFTGIVSGYEI